MKFSRLTQVAAALSWVLEFIRVWRIRRRWTPEMQLEHLRQMVLLDHQWLAHDKTADALTARYMAALAPDWFQRTHEDTSNFRQRIGLNPSTGFHPCGTAMDPRACFRVRCQLGRECVESDAPGVAAGKPEAG